MPDPIQPVAAQIQPPNPNQGIQALSGILGIQQQQQGLQLGSQQIAAGAANLQQTQQKNQQLTALSNITRAAMDPKSKYWDGDQFDADGYRRDATAVAPVYGGEAIEKNISNIKNVVETKKAFLGLGNEANKTLSGMATALGTKQGPITEDDITNLEAQGGSTIGNNAAAQRRFGAFLQQLRSTQDPAARQAIMRNGAALLGGFSQVTPATIDRGGAVVPGGTSIWGAGFTPAGAPIKKTTAPGIYQFPNQQLGQAGGEGGGGGVGGGPPQTNQPSSAQPGDRLGMRGGRQLTAADEAPPMNAPGYVQKNFGDAVSAARDHQKQIHANDDTYGANMAVTENIRQMVARGVNSGPGSKEYNDAVGKLKTTLERMTGAPVDTSKIADTQLLGALLDRQSALIRESAGLPGTNAGQAVAGSISGNVEYEPGAIGEKNDLNEALVHGQHLYRQGLDRVAGYSGNPSPTEVGKFRAAWTQNFDPMAEEYRLAAQRGDKATMGRIMQRFSPEQRQELQRKGRAIDELVQGRLPQ